MVLIGAVACWSRVSLASVLGVLGRLGESVLIKALALALAIE